MHRPGSGRYHSPLRCVLMKALAALLVLCSVLISCGEDGSSTPEDGPLTAAEREWCSFVDSSEESALRFDIIFEAGLALGLPVDAMNAQAAELNDEYLAQGMTNDEAARRTSEQLLDDETFIAACEQAYADNAGG